MKKYMTSDVREKLQELSSDIRYLMNELNIITQVEGREREITLDMAFIVAAGLSKSLHDLYHLANNAYTERLDMTGKEDTEEGAFVADLYFLYQEFLSALGSMYDAMKYRFDNDPVTYAHDRMKPLPNALDHWAEGE